MQVLPVLVWDDGESMEPGPQLQPTLVSASKLDTFAEDFRAEFHALREQLEAETPADPEV